MEAPQGSFCAYQIQVLSLVIPQSMESEIHCIDFIDHGSVS